MKRKKYLSFNNINILKNMSEEIVSMRIPTTREKLKVNFPEDPKGDFSLVFKSKVFKLQKAFLRLDSGYFKRICTSQTNILEIREDFNVKLSKCRNNFFTTSCLASTGQPSTSKDLTSPNAIQSSSFWKSIPSSNSSRKTWSPISASMSFLWL